jgi:hypothetical protein
VTAFDPRSARRLDGIDCAKYLRQARIVLVPSGAKVIAPFLWDPLEAVSADGAIGRQRVHERTQEHRDQWVSVDAEGRVSVRGERRDEEGNASVDVAWQGQSSRT